MFRPILAVITLALTLSPLDASAAEPAFSLAPLPYPANTLEPVIDAKTMEIHHGRHHKAYVDNLNAQVAQIPELAGLSLLDMQRQMSRFPTAVRNNGGGHWNHEFFWSLMTRPGSGGGPSPALGEAIERDFGGLDAMKQAFQQAGLTRFGSGWAWLIVRPDGRLAITSTPNQDNPLMDLVPETERGTPILANDVWEHAYYLAYQNRRGDYLSAWWQVVDWARVSAHHAAALESLAGAAAGTGAQ
jgi:superoxide dismutase, Fe-Mn family